MKYAVVIKTPRGTFSVYATSATEEGARKRRSYALGYLSRDVVFLVRVSADVRKDDELDESCLAQKVLV
jgi:hypothetical protein